ncbi:uncharacterized membrane protein YhaH (DUF805 family) [Curtobacterium sp. PhB130]|uniref:DUF805 domain-containing protein n=1 Tax=unclassified Curtobacterium TaxID=257496 RepID=UPI000F4C5A7F|nr:MULTISPECIES: DUF805 domain-containing protein [unclassified Curtobacterium]ROP60365.1 uncharacterized membrane protein YhaH (DUF805 family) [Curtobacterium sp. ZW137]ROS76337.1 uncharacterized membrane protein YhaH (DUF805 family) [Curtobacterium sp. PhB130]TCK59667.1 uncharacterized membrane protein YhaH (DUF805 family) [Curtobacterium sp. PhB136]
MSDQYPSQNPYGQQPEPGHTPQYGAPAPTGPGGEPPLWAPWYGISFGNAVRRFFKKYARFDGRASRSEFWWWALANAIVYIVLGILLGIGIATSDRTTVSTGYSVSTVIDRPSALYIIAAILFAIWGLAVLVPGIALYWRRLHDANLAGPFWFLGFVPGVGGIILLVFSLLPPKPEGQRFDQPGRG